MNPSEATIRVQHGGTFAVTATNLNGEIVPLNRIPNWPFDPSSTFNPRTLRLGVAVPGIQLLSLSVANGGFRSAARITVPMESLTVAPVIQFRSVWNLGPNSEINPLPDAGPAPVWDGIPAHCNAEKTIVARDTVSNQDVSVIFVQHCFYVATASVTPPTGITIDHYRWDWFDAFGLPDVSPTTSLPSATLDDRPTDVPGGFFGWSFLEVTALDANGNTIARSGKCIMNCGG